MYMRIIFCYYLCQGGYVFIGVCEQDCKLFKGGSWTQEKGLDFGDKLDHTTLGFGFVLGLWLGGAHAYPYR